MSNILAFELDLAFQRQQGLTYTLSPQERRQEGLVQHRCVGQLVHTRRDSNIVALQRKISIAISSLDSKSADLT